MNNTYQQAATILLNNRHIDANNESLAINLLPHSFEHSLNIQAEMIKQRSDAVAAWKCLLPLNEEQIIVAPIFADTVQSGESCLLFAEKNKARIEPEIAFLLGTDLPAKVNGYSEQEIDDAIQACYMALELIQDRFSDSSKVTFYEKLADCLSNQGLFLGPEIDKNSAYLASELTVNINQKNYKQQFTGKHPNQLPQNPLYWFINFMSKRGISLRAGEVMITGSYAGVVEVECNTVTHIEYEGLGDYQLTFNAITEY